jgi:hypothetical protein
MFSFVVSKTASEKPKRAVRTSIRVGKHSVNRLPGAALKHFSHFSVTFPVFTPVGSEGGRAPSPGGVTRKGNHVLSK